MLQEQNSFPPRAYTLIFLWLYMKYIIMRKAKARISSAVIFVTSVLLLNKVYLSPEQKQTN